jgi:hypothetical protein
MSELDLSDLVDEDSADAGPFHVIDASTWPLVQIRVQRAPLTNQEIDDFQAAFLAVLQVAERGNPAAGVGPAKLFLLFNLDGIVQATFAQQMRARSFIQAVRKSAETAIHATALVTTSTLARLVLMAVLSLQPLVSVNKTFDSNDAGLEWLRANQCRVSMGQPVVLDV